MKSGEQLLLQGEYEKALSKLQAEAEKDTQDDFRVGSVLGIAVALILMRRFDEAEVKLLEIIPQAWKPASPHLLMMGVLKWFSGQRKEAILNWRKSEACPYRGDDGTDVYRVLYFASVEDPKNSDIGYAKAKLRKLTPKLYEGAYHCFISNFLIDQISEAQFLEQMCRWDGKKPNLWVPGLTGLAHFYIGLKAKERNDDANYLLNLEKCAQTQKSPLMFTEITISRIKCQNWAIK